MSTTIVCPSGMSLLIRSMKGKELRILSDRDAMKNGTFLDRILAACVETVIDQGPYVLNDKGALNWDDVLSGDRVYISLQIRIATFGATLTFKATCGSCRKKEDYDVELSDLRVQVLSDEDRKAFKNSVPLAAKIPVSGEAITFRLATGGDEKRVLKLASTGRKTSDDAVISMLVRRIESVSGVEDVKTFLEDLDLGNITALLKELNKRDCGVDTAIEMACPNCGESSEVAVPIGSSPFWLPVQ